MYKETLLATDSMLYSDRLVSLQLCTMSEEQCEMCNLHSILD